jgi:threonine synthase
MSEELEEMTAAKIHRGLAGLENMEPKHQESCEQEGVKEKLEELLNL